MRCLIFSANRLFAECLCAGLSTQEAVEFAKTCLAAQEIAAVVEQHGITSVLVDLSDPDAWCLIKPLRAARPELCILALSVDDQVAAEVVGCAKIGCHGVVPRDASLKTVVQVIAAAECGEIAMRPKVVAGIMRALAEPDVSHVDEIPSCLTRREREICTLVAEGLTNKEIAREVNRSVGTIKNHVSSILTKLDVPRRGAIHAHLGQ